MRHRSGSVFLLTAPAAPLPPVYKGENMDPFDNAEMEPDGCGGCGDFCAVFLYFVLPALAGICCLFLKWPLKTGLVALVLLAEAAVFRFAGKKADPPLVRLAAAAAGIVCVLYIMVFLK